MARPDRTQHPRHLGRRHRHLEPELLHARADGLPDAQHRPHRRRRACCSPTPTASRAAPPAARRSSPGRASTAPACRKVGIPGAPIGMQAEDPTIAELLKPLRATRPGSSARTTSATCNKFLPTVHGFDEFFGNLYHLNAEEEPEMPTIRRRRTSRTSGRASGRAACIHSWATDKDDPTEEPRWGRVGKQKIEDTGPLTKKRMETCDDEFVAAAKDFIKRQHDGRQAVLRLAQHHAHAPLHAHQAGEPRPGRALAVALSRHDDRPRQERRRRCSTCSTSSASPTTPSSCTRPTTGRT